MNSKHIKLIATLLTLMFCMGVFYAPAFAAEIGDLDEVDELTAVVEPTENEAGDIMPEYVDFEPDVEGDVPDDSDTDMELIELESLLLSGSGFRPFTPSGTGTVVDNAIDGDGKEFYNISTVDGDIFYLIIDRQRNTQNVYFLNAVTELDLLTLAVKNERELPAGTAPLPQTSQTDDEGQDPPKTVEPETPKKESNKTALYVFLAIAVIGGGGAAYYFKIVKGKKNIADDDDYGDDDSDGEDEYGYEDEPEDDSDNENDGTEDGGEEDE